MVKSRSLFPVRVFHPETHTSKYLFPPGMEYSAFSTSSEAPQSSSSFWKQLSMEEIFLANSGVCRHLYTKLIAP